MPGNASGSLDSSIARSASITVTAISGMLTQKIARQEISSTSAPPPAGPKTVAIPVQAVQVPTALAALLALEGGGDDRQRPGHEQRPGDPLQRPRADQELLARGERAEDRGAAEGDEPDDEEPPPAELVPEAAADQEQRDHRQHVGLDHPLLPGQPGVQLPPQRGQRDVDDRAVEEDDGRAEDRRDQGEALLPGHPPSLGSARRPRRPRKFPAAPVERFAPGLIAGDNPAWRERSGPVPSASGC